MVEILVVVGVVVAALVGFAILGVIAKAWSH